MGNILAVRTCPFCGNATKIYVTEETANAFGQYQAGTISHIQDIPVPQFDSYRCKAIVREFLKTGYCLDCQQLIFGGAKKDEEVTHGYLRICKNKYKTAEHRKADKEHQVCLSKCSNLT